MPTTTKKGSPSNRVKSRAAAVKPSLAKEAQTTAELRRELAESLQREKATAIDLQDANRQLTQAFEQQSATGEILRLIASSTTDLQPVLNTVAENAARVCGASDAIIRLVEGDGLRLAAHFGSIDPGPAIRPLNRGSVLSRAVIDRRVIHIDDLMSEIAEYPNTLISAQRANIRTTLAVPLLRDGVAIGAIHIPRTKIQPFTEKEIVLLESFADQAVIAIENARLLRELTKKSTELESSNSELREALEQQTATSEILGVIASSPTDIQPVLKAVTENAARLCDANDAQIRLINVDRLEHVASYGTMPATKNRAITAGFVGGRAIIEGRTIHVHDIEEVRETEYPETPIHGNRNRSVLAVPLMREGSPIGVINIRRLEVRPFTEQQMRLLETFADQAVIAIENVRLFQELGERNAELREALEHQTATAEVLGIISRSPTDVQPVLDAIVESAAKVCGIDDLGLRLRDGNDFVSRARFGPIAVGFSHEKISIDEPRFRWIVEHGTLHIPDARAQNDFPMLGVLRGARTFLLVPLRQQGEVLGTLTARRTKVRPFTPAQIKLLETFADQAVIAIENARLFNELKEALEQQTATSEILGVIASSPTDIKPVLDVVADAGEPTRRYAPR
jgi:two-component system, NtrC family, sensor kinase